MLGRRLHAQFKPWLFSSNVVTTCPMGNNKYGKWSLAAVSDCECGKLHYVSKPLKEIYMFICGNIKGGGGDHSICKNGIPKTPKLSSVKLKRGELSLNLNLAGSLKIPECQSIGHAYNGTVLFDNIMGIIH